MINDVDETLRQMLVGELAKIPERGALSDLKVFFNAPAQAGAAKDAAARSVYLLLHDLRENLQRREEFYHVNRHKDDRNLAGRTRAPIHLDLAYLVSVEADDGPRVEHQLLSDVLGVMLRCDMVPAEYFQGSLSFQQPGAIKLTVATAEHPAHADLAALWQSLGSPLRPSITLVASVMFNPFVTRWTQVVREVFMGLHPSADPANRASFLIDGLRVSAAGIVVAQGKDVPLSGATVRVTGTEFTTVSDKYGVFFLTNLPAGRHTLQVSLRGFQPFEQQVTVYQSGRPERDEPILVELAPLSAEAWQQAATPSPVGALLIEQDRYARVSIAGRLTYADSRPAAYIPLRLGARKTVTDGAGFYLFSDMPLTHEEIVAELPGSGEVIVQTTKGGDSVVNPAPAGLSGKKKPVSA